MTNFEKHKNKILEITEKNSLVGVNKETGEVVNCPPDDLRFCAEKCKFGIKSCHVKFIQWLYEEIFYSGKIACISTQNDKLYKKGKIYEVKDGVLYSELGAVPMGGLKFREFDEIEKHTSAEWLEIVED